MLTDGLLVLMLQESRWFGDSQIVLAFASLGDKVLLANHLFFDLAHESEALVFGIFLSLALGFSNHFFLATQRRTKDELLTRS